MAHDLKNTPEAKFQNQLSFTICYHSFPETFFTDTLISVIITFVNIKLHQLTDLTDPLFTPGIFHAIKNANSIVKLAIQVRNGIMKHANVSVKVIVRVKNIIVKILAHVLVKMVSILNIKVIKYLKSNTLAANVTSTMSVNYHNKKERYKIDYYILHTVLLVIVLLLIITIIYYHYAKHKSKLKNILPC